MVILGLVVVLIFVLLLVVAVGKHASDSRLKERIRRYEENEKYREKRTAYLTGQLHEYSKFQLVITMKDGTVLTEQFEPKIEELYYGVPSSLSIIGAEEFIEARIKTIKGSVEFFEDNTGVYRRKDEISTMEIKDVPNGTV